MLPIIDEHLELAFPNGGSRSYASDHFLLLTNARKLDGEGAEKREHYVAYHERLGELYRLGSAPPRATAGVSAA